MKDDRLVTVNVEAAKERETLLAQEAARYFKERPGFRRLLDGFYKKWKTYGREAGIVCLKKISEEERKALSGLLGRHLSSSDVRISAMEFMKALQESKFHGVTMEALLISYYGSPVITNKDARACKVQKKHDFFCSLLEGIRGEPELDSLWIEHVISQKKYGYHLIASEYERAQASDIPEVQLQSMTDAVMNTVRAFANVCNKTEAKIRLAVLAARLTGNPHYLDRQSVPGKLLISMLSFHAQMAEPQNAEEILELYYGYEIWPDDLSSQVILFGIHLYDEIGEHPAYGSFLEKREPYVVTLFNLNRIDRADSRKNTVFVFENQMVFSHMCEMFSDADVSMVCTSGQLKTAALMLIDLLCRSGCSICYSGDIDPEGIQIADKLISRAPNRIRPWRMDTEEYAKCMSQEVVSDTRMKKLESLKDCGLQRVAAALRIEKKAGYQELLLDDLQQDIQNELNQQKST